MAIRYRKWSVLVILLVAFSSMYANAWGYYWVGGSGSTTDPSHWSLTPGGPGGAGVPSVLNYDDANIITSDATNRVITGGLLCGSIFVSSTGAGIVTINGPLFVEPFDFSVSGNVIVNGHLSSFPMNVNAGGILWNNASSYSDMGTFINFSTVNQTSGTIHSYHYLDITGGTYNLSGGIIESESNDIGSQTFNHTGGTVGLWAMITNIHSGTYNLSGTGVIASPASSLSISGIFNQTGGKVGGGGLGTHMSGTYNLAGGSLNLGGGDIGDNKNTGTFNYSGGNFSTSSPFYNNGTTTLSGSGTRVVDGSVVNNGTWKVTNTTALYTGAFTNNGVYISDPSKNYFKDLYVGPAGYLIGGSGDEFHFSGDFLNHSQSPFWNTALADLIFSSGLHNFYIGESGAFYWDDLTLKSGAMLHLGGGAAFYVDELNFVNLAQFQGVGTIYFQNLNGSGIGGHFSVPEPATMLLLGLGLIGLAAVRRKLKD